MSCANTSKSTLKVTINVFSVLFLLSAFWSIYIAISQSAPQYFGSALWSVIIAGLGIYGTRKENICMLKAFAINAIILLILIIIICILGLVAVFSLAREHPEIRTTSVTALLLLHLLGGIIFQGLSALYGFRLASIIKEEMNSGATYSGQTIHAVSNPATEPSPYSNFKSGEPRV